MVDKAVVDIVKSYLAQVRAAGIRASRGVVFGSCARGTANEDSDIDLIVLAPEFDGKRDRSNSDLLWAVRARTDSRVEPIGVGERQWEEDDETPIIEIARREGFEVRV